MTDQDCWCVQDGCLACPRCRCHLKTRGGEALDWCGLPLRPEECP